jgi:crossover junction endodeoxyribonuclease RuvC
LTVIIAADPGISGAACAFYRADADGPEFIADVIDLPAIDDGARREIDVLRFVAWVRKMQPVHAFVENVQPMPSIPDKYGKRRTMGAATTFRFGLVVGQIRATIACCGVPISLIHPQVWKRFYDLKGADKEQSRQKALELHPEAAHWLKRKLDHGRSEAILLARYGDRHLIAHRRGLNVRSA